MTFPQEFDRTSYTPNALFSKELCDNISNGNVVNENDNNHECNNLTTITPSSILENYSERFIIMGVLSLLGILIVLIYEIKTLMQLSKRDAEEAKINTMLVLKLCLADVLIAIYFIVLPNTLKIAFTLERATSTICDALGVTSVLSL